MAIFHDAREARGFLIAQIVQQAEFEQSPVSAIERKILDYMEYEDSPFDIREVVVRFAGERDAEELLSRIGSLLVRAYLRMNQEAPREQRKWRDSWKILKKENHFLAAIVGALIRHHSDRWDSLGSWAAVLTVVTLVGVLYVEIEFHVLPQWFRDLDLNFLRVPLFLVILFGGWIVRVWRKRGTE